MKKKGKKMRLNFFLPRLVLLGMVLTSYGFANQTVDWGPEGWQDWKGYVQKKVLPQFHKKAEEYVISECRKVQEELWNPNSNVHALIGVRSKLEERLKEPALTASQKIEEKALGEEYYRLTLEIDEIIMSAKQDLQWRIRDYLENLSNPLSLAN